MKDKVREYYENNRTSFQRMSDRSTELFGKPISIDQIKKWSSEDGGWIKPSAPADERRKVIADKIFECIENIEIEGASNEDAKTLTQLARVYLDFTIKAPEGISNNRPSIQDIIEEIQKV